VLFEIAAVIGLTGKNFTGSIALCFPKEVFLKVMTNMLGEPYTDITDDMQDGAAELLNMIFGQAKIVLNEAGYEIEKAIPTVIKGHQIETQHPADRPVLVFPFRTEAGVFHIEIVTEQKADSK
jgi:chemotaxis protein CheX